MRDWIAKLDAFLKLSEREILLHAGRISHEVAVAMAGAEYEPYRQLSQSSEVEKHFEEAVEKIKRLQPGKAKKERRTENK